LKQVIFAPDLIGAAFIDPRARAVLEQWRDGEFKIILNRQLLLRYLKTLRDLGLPSHLLKRWTLWLTSAEKSNYLNDFETNEKSAIKTCEAIPSAQIICSRKIEGASDRWISVNEFFGQSR
jgi:hypothetical protein